MTELPKYTVEFESGSDQPWIVRGLSGESGYAHGCRCTRFAHMAAAGPAIESDIVFRMTHLAAGLADKISKLQAEFGSLSGNICDRGVE